MSVEVDRSKEKESERYPYLGIVGATGAGKSELGNILAKAWREDVGIQQEVYPDNPWLEPFYNSPQENSLLSEMFFLEQKIAQMRKVRGLLNEKIQIHDPALWLDTEVYAFVHNEFGWMSNDEYKTYMMTAETLSSAAGIPKPDVIIATIASPDTVCKRIVERGRDYEIKFMDKFPDYFPRLAKRVKEWVSENPHNVPIIEIDTDKFNYVISEKDKKYVVKEVADWTRYRLFGPRSQGITQDGMQLIFPSILQPTSKISEIPPRSVRPRRSL